MKKQLILSIGMGLLLLFSGAVSDKKGFSSNTYLPIPQVKDISELEKSKVLNILENLPLYFVENKGQLDKEVLYYAKVKDGTVYFTKEGIVYKFLSRDEKPSQPNDLKTKLRKGSVEVKEEVVLMRFVGMNKNVKVKGLEETETKFNYFKGNNPSKWVYNARSYKKIIYEDLYPGINLIIHGDNGKLKSEYRVKPSAEPKDIKLKFEGAKSIKLGKNGELIIKLQRGVLKEECPKSYQEIDNKRIFFETKYKIGNCITIDLKDYRKDKELIIDPLIFSTYLGGSSGDFAYDITTDANGNIYICGKTDSADFPLQGGFDWSLSLTDAFVTKIDKSGRFIIFSSYLGGSNNDYSTGIVIDSNGNIILVGTTQSPDFPAVGGLDTRLDGSSDAFITKINYNGANIIASTYLGGSNSEWGNDVKVDNENNIYVCGTTMSADFPIYGFDWTLGGSYDGFVAKINSSLSSLIFSTYWGGSDIDICNAIAIDGNKDIFITGYTKSNDFYRVNCIDCYYNGGTDAYVSKLYRTGMSCDFSTYLGGSGDDYAWGIDVKTVYPENSTIYITGQTNSTNFPLVNAFDSTQKDIEAFVSVINFKFYESSANLLFSTYLGGDGRDIAYSIVLSGQGVYICGTTTSSDFPTTFNAISHIKAAGQDAFLTKIATWNNRPVYSSYLGGNHDDVAWSIKVDTFANVYICGQTLSSDFPVQGAYDSTYNGYYDTFIMKICTEYINTPCICSGPVEGYPNQIYTYGTWYAYSELLDPVEYLFDWGDGTNSGWIYGGTGGGEVEANKMWPFCGTFKVKAKARCAIHPYAESDWSPEEIVTIESVSRPNSPNGPANGIIGETYLYNVEGSFTCMNHSIQYLIDWGDGTNSGWLPVGTTSASHSWSSPRTYYVRAKARCATHTSLESSWSEALPVTISTPFIPDIYLPSTTLSFGDVPVGSSKELDLTIQNVGSATLTINNVSWVSGSSEFSLVSFTSSIPAGGSGYVRIRFSPSTVGTKTATFNINSNDPDEKDVPFTATGNGVSQPSSSASKIGIFRENRFYLDYNGNGVWEGPTVDKQYTFGTTGDIPVAGDWNGDGKAEIGVFRGGTSWYLDYNGNGAWDGPTVDKKYTFGTTGDIPVAGRW